MPGWHKAISQLPESTGLATAGVVLEQHPDRARLFMQWHEMDWPVMWDPFNLLGFPVVPVTYLLDPEGRVLLIQPLMDRVREISQRLADSYDSVDFKKAADGPPDSFTPRLKASAGGDAPSDWADHGISLALWGDAGNLDVAVDALQEAVARSDDPVLRFRLGVVLRMRYDSVYRKSGDFATAVDAWSRALNADPNQYIWRRRLQQYGPRLAKPYPFYDWVPRARAEIEARAEDPVPLLVEPHGAELARPATDAEVEPDNDVGSGPDPDAQVHADDRALIEVETVVIPPTPQPGTTARVHLILTPNHRLDAHWNNEAGHSELWVDPPSGWEVDIRHQRLHVGPGDVSDETRHLEFEVMVPKSADFGATLNGYLLYYACEGVTGVCVYRRQGLAIPIPIPRDNRAVGLAG